MSSSKCTAMHHLLNRHRSWQKSFSLPPKIDGIIFCFLSYHIKMKNLLQIGKFFCFAGYGKHREWEERYNTKRKAQVEAAKAATRAEDMEKGIFIPVSQLS